MGTKSIWGWGGIRFTYGSQDVTFSTSFIDMEFDPVKITLEMQDGTLYDKQRGFRARLNADLVNYDDGDSEKMQTLLSMINNAAGESQPLTIYPKYETPDLGQNWSGLFNLSSKISFEDIARNTFIGQDCKLSFIGAVIIPTMPTNVSDTELAFRSYDSTDPTALRLYDSTDVTALRKSQ